MDKGSFESMQLKLNDAIAIKGIDGSDVKGFYLDEYNPESGTFAFSNFKNGQVEVIVIEHLQQLHKA